MSGVLHSAAQTNAWRALLRLRSNYKPTDAYPPLMLQPVGSERNTDMEEVMCALTRLTIGDTSAPLSSWLKLSIGSSWSLFIDPKVE